MTGTASSSGATAGTAVAALAYAATHDGNLLVRAAAAAPPGPIPARSEWRSFYVVDPSADDARVRQEPYFVVSSDDLVWATYTDARGEITTEHIPADTSHDDVLPESHETEY